MKKYCDIHYKELEKHLVTYQDGILRLIDMKTGYMVRRVSGLTKPSEINLYITYWETIFYGSLFTEVTLN